mmetsp:Transcript_8227/g.19127  ORF Transcript_8227/g.19127 Transcript_8227/m.19127 type:complete len:218 (-) Transcript_8227:99-752(-)
MGEGLPSLLGVLSRRGDVFPSIVVAFSFCCTTFLPCRGFFISFPSSSVSMIDSLITGCTRLMFAFSSSVPCIVTCSTRSSIGSSSFGALGCFGKGEAAPALTPPPSLLSAAFSPSLPASPSEAAGAAAASPSSTGWISEASPAGDACSLDAACSSSSMCFAAEWMARRCWFTLSWISECSAGFPARALAAACVFAWSSSSAGFSPSFPAASSIAVVS